MRFDDFLSFVTERRRMSDIYQPVLIRALRNAAARPPSGARTKPPASRPAFHGAGPVQPFIRSSLHASSAFARPSA
jgi:hypothetical protein